MIHPNVVILLSAHYPFIRQLCIAIPINCSTPYNMLVAPTTHYNAKQSQSVKYLAGYYRASVIYNRNIQGARTSPRRTRSEKVVKYKDD
jgi:hypothetical protein